MGLTATVPILSGAAGPGTPRPGGVVDVTDLNATSARNGHVTSAWTCQGAAVGGDVSFLS